MEDPPPSGSWTGYYVYAWARYSRHRMDLDLHFKAARILGAGSDDIGPFSIRGWLEADSERLGWVKAYATHDVSYSGFRDARGIWGTWEIPPGMAGGFRIWPKGLGSDESIETAEEIPEELLAGVTPR